MAWYELIYGTFFEPSATFKYINREKPLAVGFYTVIAVYVFGFLFDFGMLRNSLPQIKNLAALHLNTSGGFYWFYGLIGLPVCLLAWFVMSSIYSMLGNMICGRYNPQGILGALAFAMLPGLLSPPLEMIGRSFGWNAFQMLVWVGVPVWIAVLQVIGLREALEVDSGQALAVWVMPIAVVFVLVLFFAISMVGMFSQLFA